MNLSVARVPPNLQETYPSDSSLVRYEGDTCWVLRVAASAVRTWPVLLLSPPTHWHLVEDREHGLLGGKVLGSILGTEEHTRASQERQGWT